MSACGKCEGMGQVRTESYNFGWQVCETCQGTGDVEAANYRQSISDLENKCARLQQEAEGHVMEARTANATIADIYQVVTGSTGEPGNWNGAEPVRQFVAELQQRIATLETATHAEANEAALNAFAARCERLQGSLSRVGRELDTARETNRRLNERCQIYEKAIAEKVKEHPGPSFGRALANAEAERLSGLLEATQAERDTAVAERDRLRGAFYSIGAAIANERCDSCQPAPDKPGYRCDRCLRERLVAKFLGLKRAALEEASDGQ